MKLILTFFLIHRLKQILSSWHHQLKKTVFIRFLLLFICSYLFSDCGILWNQMLPALSESVCKHVGITSALCVCNTHPFSLSLSPSVHASSFLPSSSPHPTLS